MAGEVPLTATLPIFTIGSTFTVYCILMYILLTSLPKFKSIKPVHILFVSVLCGFCEHFIGAVSYVGWFHDAPCSQRKASTALYMTSYFTQDLFLIIRMRTLLTTNISSSDSILSKPLVKKVLLGVVYSLWIASVAVAYTVTGMVEFAPKALCSPLLYGTTAGAVRMSFVSLEAVINLITSFVFFFILRDSRRGFTSGTAGTLSSGHKGNDLAYKLEVRSAISAVCSSFVIVVGVCILVSINAGAYNMVEIYAEHALISALLVYSNVLSKKSKKVRTTTQVQSSTNPSTHATNASAAKKLVASNTLSVSTNVDPTNSV